MTFDPLDPRHIHRLAGNVIDLQIELRDATTAYLSALRNRNEACTSLSAGTALYIRDPLFAHEDPLHAAWEIVGDALADEPDYVPPKIGR